MTTYSRCEPDEWPQVALRKVIASWHQKMAAAEVSFCILMAANATDAPLKLNGHAVLGMVKVVPLDMRVAGLPDVVIKLDSREWEDLTNESQIALLDHLMCRISLAEKESSQGSVVVERDDVGRPKIAKRNADWNGGDGFRNVVERHGDDAIEFINSRRVFTAAKAAKEEAEVGAP